MMNIKKYLQRFQFKGLLTPNADLLRQLHLHHVQNIPFKNLNNYLGSPILLKPEWLYEKIVDQNRGGYCYELNGLFYYLLKKLGFDAYLLPRRLYDKNQLLENS